MKPTLKRWIRGLGEDAFTAAILFGLFALACMLDGEGWTGVAGLVTALFAAVIGGTCAAIDAADDVRRARGRR